MQTIDDSTTVRPRDSALATTIDGETVILETESGTYYGLNEVGTFIWNYLSDADDRSVDAIREAMLAEYDVDRERCDRDLAEFLETMVDSGLVHVDGDV